jgi:galactoside O-acetyltransferase
MEDFSGLSWGCQLFSRSDDFTGRYMTNPTVPPKYTNVSRGTIKLCRHALVGAQTVLLPKVTLGEGVAVGTLSLVSKDLAAWGIYSGVPAKWIKERNRELLQLEKNLLNEISDDRIEK